MKSNAQNHEAMNINSAEGTPPAGMRPPGDVKGLFLASARNLAGLHAMAGRYLKLARLHKAPLAAAGWKPADTRALVVLDEAYKAAFDSRTEARAHRANTKKDEEAARAVAELFSRKLIKAFRLSIQRGSIGSLPLAVLKAGKPGSAGTLAWLSGCKLPVAKHEKQLSALIGSSASAELGEHIAALEAAVLAHAAASAGVVAQTKVVKAKALLALQLILELRTAAGIAFAGDRSTLRTFELSKERKRKKTKPAAKSAEEAEPVVTKPAETAEAAAEKVKEAAGQPPANDDAKAA